MPRFKDDLIKMLGKETYERIRAFVAAARAEGKSTDEIEEAVRKTFAKEIARIDPVVADSHVFGLAEDD